MPKVIYLTGAPASGKSSTSRRLLDRRPDIAVWEYGLRLTEHLNRTSIGLVDQDQLRTLSSVVATPEDINELGRKLIEFVDANRALRNVLIDSHPVTKEPWGFRITPFSLSDFEKLAPDEIWMLYASPEVTVDRIAKDAAGRPTISTEQARMHTAMQASVAATYGMSLGRPVYLFDSSGPQDDLVNQLDGRLA